MKRKIPKATKIESFLRRNLICKSLMINEIERWLPRKDLNLDKMNQNHLCYRYTTGHFGLCDF